MIQRNHENEWKWKSILNENDEWRKRIKGRTFVSAFLSLHSKSTQEPNENESIYGYHPMIVLYDILRMRTPIPSTCTCTSTCTYAQCAILVYAFKKNLFEIVDTLYFIHSSFEMTSILINNTNQTSVSSNCLQLISQKPFASTTYIRYTHILTTHNTSILFSNL